MEDKAGCGYTTPQFKERKQSSYTGPCSQQLGWCIVALILGTKALLQGVAIVLALQALRECCEKAVKTEASLRHNANHTSVEDTHGAHSLVLSRLKENLCGNKQGEEIKYFCKKMFVCHISGSHHAPVEVNSKTPFDFSGSRGRQRSRRLLTMRKVCLHCPGSSVILIFSLRPHPHCKLRESTKLIKCRFLLVVNPNEQ
ncbi:unnamed protein product [Lepidochelys kempii]